jgi:hypothetical protein
VGTGGRTLEVAGLQALFKDRGSGFRCDSAIVGSQPSHPRAVGVRVGRALPGPRTARGDERRRADPAGRSQAARRPRTPRRAGERDRPRRDTDRPAVGRRATRHGEEHPSDVHLAPAQGSRSRADRGASVGVRASPRPTSSTPCSSSSSSARPGPPTDSPIASAPSCERRSRCGEDRRSPTSPWRNRWPARSPASRSSPSPRWKNGSRRISPAGRDTDLIGELDGLTREHPLRERLKAGLMLALSVPRVLPQGAPRPAHERTAPLGSTASPRDSA